ncbi:Breast carcinoma amplified sequence 3 [Phytophthora boehmeriae]|uniref:Breast carcinoma amplified sequence 3 n=1 Tax=Phytophthora boehmeriae TaxID=109152 RepID=A0A8T1X6W8_9STRA|nr:Breast carcinoma amplified sequence 3 [Phytophthora boehmeriae]
MDPTKDPARLSDVRFFHLYQPPGSADPAMSLGGIFISERSSSSSISDDEDSDFVAAVVQEEDDAGHEDISVMLLDEQRLLQKLPPSPSLVLDVQTNATTAAVLCETRELFLYDLATFQLQQYVLTASPAMALGARWLAYPGFAQDAGINQVNGQQPSLTSSHGDSDSDYDDIPIEALVTGGVAVEARDASHSSSPSNPDADPSAAHPP